MPSRSRPRRRRSQPLPVQVLGIVDLATALAGIIVRATASDTSGQNLGYGLIGAAFLSALILVPVLQALCRPRGRAGGPPSRGGQATQVTDATTLSWRFGTGPDELLLSMARPPGWDMFDLLAALRQARPEPLAAEILYGLGKACPSAGLVAITGMVSSAPGSPLTWCVALGYGPDLQPELDRGEGDPADLPAGQGRRVTGTREIALLRDSPPVPVYTDRYLIRSPFGPLALTFLAPHADGAGEFGALFARLAGTCRLTRATAGQPASTP